MQNIHIKGVYFSSKILCIIAINLCTERILIKKLIKVKTNNSNSPYHKSSFNIIQIGKCLIQSNSKIQEKNFKTDFFFLLKLKSQNIIVKQSQRGSELRSILSRKNFPLGEISVTMVSLQSLVVSMTVLH